MKKPSYHTSKIVCLQFLGAGQLRGWLAPILKEASDPFAELPLTSEECSWMASLSYISRGTCPLLFPFLVDRIGRNTHFYFSAIVNFTLWVAVYWSRNVSIHYGLRLLTGVCEGVLDGLASIYVCENCSPHLRGTFFTIAVLFYFGGNFLAFVQATFCSYSTIAITNGVLAFIALCSTFLLVESAQYYLLKGDTIKAEQSFARVRNLSDPSVREEFVALKKNIEEEKSKTFNWATCCSKEVTRSFRVLLIMLFSANSCGMVTVSAFVTKLFSNFSGLSANQFSILYAFFVFICVGISPAIIDRINRRTLFMISGAFICLNHVAIVVLYGFQNTYGTPYFDSILFVLLTTFSCVFAMFVYPLMCMIRGEIMPQSVKMVGTGLSSVMIGSVSFIVARTFLPITETFGVEYNFIIYCSSAIFLVVYLYFELPETRGKTLVEIQDMLKYGRENSYK